MNLDPDTSEALSRSLGHISRQRIRYIQMELRRFATDARMKNERHFWTLLENNGLRLPKRTAGNFITKVRDQRGINIEHVVRYLKNSHKKTRRDSIVALIKGEEVTSLHKKHETSSADHKHRKITKRVSIDEFRRVGRLVVNASSATEKMKDMISSVEGRTTVVDEEDEQELEHEQGGKFLQMLMDTNKPISDDETAPRVTQTKQTENDHKKDYLTVPQPEQKRLPTPEDPLGPSDELSHKVKEKKKDKKQHVIIIKVEDTDIETLKPQVDTENGELQPTSSEGNDDSPTEPKPQNVCDDAGKIYPASVSSEKTEADPENIDPNGAVSKDESNIKEERRGSLVSQGDSTSSEIEENILAKEDLAVTVAEKASNEPEIQFQTRQTDDSSIIPDEGCEKENLSTNTESEIPDEQNEQRPTSDTEGDIGKDPNTVDHSDSDGLQSEQTEKDTSVDNPTETFIDVPEYSGDSFTTDTTSEVTLSESQSMISDSDNTEDQGILDSRSIASFGGVDVDVGGFRVTMYPPNRYQNGEFSDVMATMETSSRPKLDVEWVYGCESLHAQCMASLGNDEIAYGAGCIVVLCNHGRSTQRHYSEHSGPITCIAVHPNHESVASSQGQTPSTAINATSSHDYEADFIENDGSQRKIYVRVWRVDDLTTLYTFGSGTFQGNVRKMQFMKYQQYLVTIEDDDVSSLTLWDAGCKLKRMPTVVDTSIVADLKSNKKSDNSPRAVACSRRPTPEFVIAGKEHLGFWKITEAEVLSSGLEREHSVEIIGPQRGDFVKQFRPRHVTCCITIERHAVGYIVSGDSNGTIMIWSDQDKEVVAAANHAHECPISCVAATRAHVFSGGSNDRSVCAFAWGKDEMERVGRITLPDNVGKITSICQAVGDLFVATTLNIIVATSLNHPAYLRDLLRPSTASRLPTPVHCNPKERPNKTREEVEEKNIFNHWYPNEIARGSKETIKCACISNRLAKCLKSSTPTLSKRKGPRSSKFSKRKGPRSARTRRHNVETLSIHQMYSARHSTGVSRNDRPHSSIMDRCLTPEDRPSSAVSSPILRTSERLLRRKRGKQGKDVDKPILLFPKENYIDKDAFKSPSFPTGAETNYLKQKQNSENSQSVIIWTATTDGWIFGYDGTKHCIVARFKLPESYRVESMDCSSTRGLIALGCCDGVTVLVGIDYSGFKVLSETNHCPQASKRHPVTIARFSKKGWELAVGVGDEIVLNSIMEDGLCEIERFQNHTRSVDLVSLDWSSVRLHGSYLLRACYLNPEPETCVWSVDDFQSVKDLSTLRNIPWHAQSSPLEFSIKGIWSHSNTTRNIPCLAVTNVPQKRTAEEFGEDAGGTDLYESPFTAPQKCGNVCIVGDESGCLKIYHHPCISSLSAETVLRPFYSPVSCIRSSQHCVVALSRDDRSMIQFDAVQDGDRF